jgi:hypothetical protein
LEWPDKIKHAARVEVKKAHFRKFYKTGNIHHIGGIKLVLRKDVNLKLLFLIVVVVIALASVGINYQIRLNELQEEYETSLNRLALISKELNEEKKNVLDYEKLKDLTDKDMEILEKSCFKFRSEFKSLKDSQEQQLEGVTSRVFRKTLCKASGNAECASS